MAVFHDDHRILEGMDGDIEVCAEVLGAKPANYPMIREIPTGLYASVIHKGSYRALITDTYPALYNWLKDHNYPVLGPSMEMYLATFPIAQSPENSITEVQIPVYLGSLMFLY